MASRYSGGIAGWIAGALPLVAVNIADYFGVFAFQDAMVAGAVALVGGALICGVVAGSLGGRARPGMPGGAGGAPPPRHLAAPASVTPRPGPCGCTGTPEPASPFARCA